MSGIRLLLKIAEHHNGIAFIKHMQSIPVYAYLSGLSYAPTYGDSRGRQRTGLNTDVLNIAQNGLPYDTFALDEIDWNDFQRIQIFRMVAQPPGSGVIPQNHFPVNLPDLKDLVLAYYFATEVDANGTSSIQADFTRMTAVPEPSTLSLLGIVLLGLAFVRRKKAA